MQQVHHASSLISEAHADPMLVLCKSLSSGMLDLILTSGTQAVSSGKWPTHVTATRQLAPYADIFLVPHAVSTTRPWLSTALENSSVVSSTLLQLLQFPNEASGVSPLDFT